LIIDGALRGFYYYAHLEASHLRVYQ
jgi:hypothetical protein